MPSQSSKKAHSHLYFCLRKASRASKFYNNSITSGPRFLIFFQTTSAPTLLSSAFSSAASGQNTTGLLLTTLAPILLSSLEPSTSTANATPTSSSPEDGGRDFNVTEPPMSGNTTEEFKVNYYVSPPISDWVFIAACTFLVCIGSFGIISNATIIFLFIKSSLVGPPMLFL